MATNKPHIVYEIVDHHPGITFETIVNQIITAHVTIKPNQGTTLTSNPQKQTITFGYKITTGEAADAVLRIEKASRETLRKAGTHISAIARLSAIEITSSPATPK